MQGRYVISAKRYKINVAMPLSQSLINFSIVVTASRLSFLATALLYKQCLDLLVKTNHTLTEVYFAALQTDPCLIQYNTWIGSEAKTWS